MLTLAWATAWGQALEVIQLKHRSAQEVIPILQPLLESGAAISGQDYTLFVRTSPSNLAQVRAALDTLDRAPRQLFVSVRQGSAIEQERRDASVSGTLRTEDGSVSVNERPRSQSGATVRATDNSSRTTGGSVASVQVSEGMSAYVSTGTSVPVVTAVVGVGSTRGPGRGLRNGRWVVGGTEYRDLNSGFMVTPRVNGEQVILDIAQQDEKLSGGSVQSQRLTTQVTGRLGEWIEIGGISESGSRSDRGVLDRQYSTHSDDRSVHIKVELR
jgi:hypothetical protein